MEGTPFGRYQLLELLGRGGMGEVWKAFDTAMNRMVALKVLPGNLADDAQYQARFRREAQAAASLDEPHIVPIHDFGEIDGRLYVTMRLIDGKTIDELVADGPLAPPRAVSIVEQIAAASAQPTASDWYTATSNHRTSWSPRTTSRTSSISESPVRPRRPSSPARVPRSAPWPTWRPSDSPATVLMRAPTSVR